MNENQHQVINEEAGSRIDKLMADLQENLSRSQVQAWIKDGHLTVNGKGIKSNYKVQEGDYIAWEVPEPEEIELVAEDIPLEIVYEDEDVVVVNKPKGMVVHPSPGHPSGTLVNALLHHCTDLSGINGEVRPGIVHRIDKDTSGLLMVAKNDMAHQSLAEQLQAKSIDRKYLALVHGEIHHEVGTIEAPIGRDLKDRQKMGVVDNGRDAVTHFRVLELFDGFTLVECQLETGRTHQIRVHMHYIKHPIVGDPKYGQRKTYDIEGQALHARTLGFLHPRTGEWLEFVAEPPKVFEDTLTYLRQRS
ncbi:RNA pseudouridine synthase [Pontibacillus halophilus JSM 076056 = DSM 19796]|uniref:Pseudouridine synthase n=1 Tax=Pontibacillus halophilus JSM 076056 = DSM 19796 TaxID=1385510 RepID=A0A0A5IBM6_9BACI|nr:RluA family pseudouridine synthase [Pontibacillus halophilus]KGX93242.1 RNA pseudouridine synthase [Pontibacillus halophilus JSM 076056 = DSM 19796]